MDLNEIIAKAGGPMKVFDRIKDRDAEAGLTKWSVYKWGRNTRVPQEYLMLVAELAGVSLEDALRANIRFGVYGLQRSGGEGNTPGNMESSLEHSTR